MSTENLASWKRNGYQCGHHYNKSHCSEIYQVSYKIHQVSFKLLCWRWIAQPLRALTALTEDLGSSPSTQNGNCTGRKHLLLTPVLGKFNTPICQVFERSLITLIV